MNEWQNYIFNIMKVMQKHGWNEADVIYLGRERMGGEKASLEIKYYDIVVEDMDRQARGLKG